MVWDVVAARCYGIVSGQTNMMRATDRRAVGGGCGPEATLKEAPSDIFRVQQVADVLTGHADVGSGRRQGAIVQGWVWARIADHGSSRTHIACRTPRSHRGAVGLPRDQIQHTGRGRAERGPEGVVTHRKVLCVVP